MNSKERGEKMPKVVKSDANVILQKIIDERGLKKNYIASELGISPSSMSALLSGGKKFTADIALPLSKILGVPNSVFLNKSYS